MGVGREKVPLFKCEVSVQVLDTSLVSESGEGKEAHSVSNTLPVEMVFWYMVGRQLFTTT